MSVEIDSERQAQLLCELEVVLEQARLDRRTITYLEAADAVAMPGPHRIHKTAFLLEILLEQDGASNRPPRSALVVSRTRSGRPAPGFFDRAQSLGLFDGVDPEGFHDRMLQRLFQPAQS